MKRLIKIALSGVYFVVHALATALRHICGASTRPSLVILCYHAVPAPQAVAFRSQVRSLTRRSVVPADADITTLPGPATAITFDDAFVSVAENPLPILAEHHLPSTIFIPAGLLGKTPSWKFDGESTDQHETIMDAGQLRTIAAPQVSLGSHTLTHPRLPETTDATLHQELQGSRSHLEHELARPITTLAFPHGAYDDRTLAACRRAGYTRVFSITPTPVTAHDDAYVRGRVTVEPTDHPLEFFLKSRGGVRMDGLGLRREGPPPQPSNGPHTAGRRQPVVTITIRQAMQDDRPVIEAFDAAHYDEYAPYKSRARFEWQHVHNPARPQTSAALPAWLAFDAARLVGHIAAQPGTVCINHRRLSAGWMVDLLVDPAYRGRQIAQRLYHAARGTADVLLAVTMGPPFRRMCEKEGTITLGPVMQYTRLMRITPTAVRRYLLHRTRNRARLHTIARAATAVGGHWPLAAASKAVTRLRAPRRAVASANIRIEAVDVFPDDVAPLCERIAAAFSATTVRDADILNWRYVKVPDLDYRIYVARRGDSITGYSVLRHPHKSELPVGAIVELLAEPGDHETTDALLTHATGSFQEAAAIRYVSNPLIEPRLALHGFRHTSTMHPTCLCRDDTIRVLCEQAASNWLFTGGDHDLDQVWAVKD